MSVEHLLAVEHHDEMIALRRDVVMMPLAHDDRRLVLALQMAREAAGVIGVVIAFFPVERLVARRRIPDLQLVANLVRVSVLAAATKENSAVDVGGAGAE